MTRIALVDDHTLVRNGLAAIINGFGNFKVVLEADDGLQLTKTLKAKMLPDIALLDITMPKMNGFETANWLRTNHPTVKVLALSVLDSEASIIRMLKNGARGYLLKSTRPVDLKSALESLMVHGYYYNDLVTNRLINAMNKWGDNQGTMRDIINLSGREVDYLRLTCAEKSHKEIAELLYISPRTVDYYRDTLFQKLKVNSKIGLVLYALKNGIIQV